MESAAAYAPAAAPPPPPPPAEQQPAEPQQSDDSQQQPAVIDADRKILADLDVLLEKMDLCDAHLRPSGGKLTAEPVYKSDECLSVIGFLEACAPRMVELVEAAAQGAVSETVLEKCLLVNDRLTTVLSDIDAVELTDEGPPAVTATSSDDDFDAFLSERSERSATATSPLG